MIKNRTIFTYNLKTMLLFAAPLYLLAFFGWLVYSIFIKKNIKQNMSMVYVGSVFSIIWLVVFLVSL